MNTITMTDTFFTKYARFEQEKYRELKTRELKTRENSDNNINETSKSFEEIFNIFHDELKTSETPYDAILTVDNKLKKKMNSINIQNYIIYIILGFHMINKLFFQKINSIVF